MQFLTVCLLLFSAVLPTFGSRRKGDNWEPSIRGGDRSSFPLEYTSVWEKRAPPFRITECVFVTSDDDVYYYVKGANPGQVCGVYIFTDPDKIIEVTFEDFDVPCEEGGLVSFVDGWELKGNFFPDDGDEEKTIGNRYREFCGVEKRLKSLTSSQNAAMLHYRLPTEENGFGFYVKFVKSPTPCNILVENHRGVYTIKNYGKANNCTLMAVFPAKVRLLALNVGVLGPGKKNQAETGTIRKCRKSKAEDFLLIGGSEGFASSGLVPVEEVCGLDSSPGKEEMTIGCGVTVVKLHSSGQYDNSATFSVELAGEEDLLQSAILCDVM